MPMLASDTRAVYRVEGGGQLAQLHGEAFTLRSQVYQQRTLAA